MTLGVVKVFINPDTTGAAFGVGDDEVDERAATVDIACLVDDLSIQHGRADADSQPEAATCTINLDLAGEPMPEAVDIGSRVTIREAVAGQSPARFTGRITDIALGWDDAGEHTPNAGMAQIIATNSLADLGRRVVGAEPFPQELDGARVARVLALAGVVLDPGTSDPGTVEVNPRDIDARSALEVAQATAESAGGMLWHTRTGEIRYADNVHRRGAASEIELDACDVLVTPTWGRTLAGLINKATVAYGIAPESGEQPTVSATNAASVAKYGTYDYSLTSELATVDDATARVNELLARNGSPIWAMPALPIDIASLLTGGTNVINKLEVGSLITLTGLPAIADAPTTAHLWVEGWAERYAFGVHEIELKVSGFCRTAPAPWWDDLQPAQTWDTVGTLTWDDAACLGPPLPGGRWTDVPASVRWDAVKPDVTWDNYQPTQEAA